MAKTIINLLAVNGTLVVGKLEAKSDLPEITTVEYAENDETSGEAAAIALIVESVKNDKIVPQFVLSRSAFIKVREINKAVNTVRKHGLDLDGTQIVDYMIQGLSYKDGSERGSNFGFIEETEVADVLVQLADGLLATNKSVYPLNSRSIYRVQLLPAGKKCAKLKGGEKVTLQSTQYGFEVVGYDLSSTEFSQMPDCEHTIEVREIKDRKGKSQREYFVTRMIKTATGYMPVAEAFDAFCKGTLDLGESNSSIRLINLAALNLLCLRQVKDTLIDMKKALAI